MIVRIFPIMYQYVKQNMANSPEVGVTKPVSSVQLFS